MKQQKEENAEDSGHTNMRDEEKEGDKEIKEGRKEKEEEKNNEEEKNKNKEKKEKEKEILVSVVITVKNSEKWLDECMASVLNQTHRPLEVVVFEDCSQV